MELSVSTHIHATAKEVWKIIANIEGSKETIGGILDIEVLEKPKGKSLIGLKWKETRKFAGKEATETMWITDAKVNHFYATRAESHGAIYKSSLTIEEAEDGCTLTMSFEGLPQTTGAKIMWALTGWMATKAMKKTIAEDLKDIKRAAEEE